MRVIIRVNKTSGDIVFCDDSTYIIGGNEPPSDGFDVMMIKA